MAIRVMRGGPVPASSSTGFVDLGLPHGFVNRADSIVSWDDLSRTLTIGPLAPAVSFDIYLEGAKYNVAAPETVVITDTEGIWWFYYNNAGVLTATQTTFNFFTEAGVSIIYWDAVNKTAFYIAEERHGLIDPNIHHYLHHTRGAAYDSGLSLGDYTLIGDGSANSHAQCSISNGDFHDADIEIEITHSAAPANIFEQILAVPAELPIFYQLGTTGIWRGRAATTYPFYDDNPNRPSYNQFTGPNWVLTEVTNNYYFNAFVLATNNGLAPVMVILGQGEYPSLSAAEAEEYSTLDLTGIPVAEIVVLYRLTFQTKTAFTNAPEAVLKGVLDYRYTQKAGASASPTVHNSTANRDDFAAHPYRALEFGAPSVKVAAYPITGLETSLFFIGDGTGAVVPFTLPDAASFSGGVIWVKARNIANLVDVTPAGADTLDNGLVASHVFSSAGDTVGFVQNEAVPPTGWERI